MGDSNSVKEMSIKQAARWLALYEGVNLIGDESMERDVDFNKLTLKIKPLKDFIRTNSKIIEDDITYKTKRAKVEL